MTDPKPDTANKSKSAKGLFWPLLAIAGFAAAWGWFSSRPLSPEDRRAQIELCRTKYARARTHGDTILVDGFTFAGPRREMHLTVCRDYRISGMR